MTDALTVAPRTASLAKAGQALWLTVGDGPTTLQRMRADPRFANIPVVFVTAKAMPAEVARFRELGAVAVIAKPFDPMQLGQQIVTIWEGLNHG